MGTAGSAPNHLRLEVLGETSARSEDDSIHSSTVWECTMLLPEIKLKEPVTLFEVKDSQSQDALACQMASSIQ